MSISLDAIALPADLIWADEFAWSPVQQQQQYTLTGIKQAGRPITLIGGANAGWVTRATVKALYAKLDDAGPFTLTLNDASTHSVVFSHDQTPIEAAPIIDYNNPDDGDLYSLTLRFIKL
jgi:hypothetical protein